MPTRMELVHYHRLHCCSKKDDTVWNGADMEKCPRKLFKAKISKKSAQCI
jgi:hypothetical protein